MSNVFKASTAVLIAAAAVGVSGCGSPTSTDADVASANLSMAADNFEIPRRITFVNGITDKAMLTIEGKCNITDDTNQLEVVCKTGLSDEAKSFKKHFLGLSDNVTYFVEQLSGAEVSTSRYRVTVKPSALIPDIEVR